MNIPCGYQLHVTTWENDGDCYATKTISGLSKDEVAFYIALAKKFCSKHDQTGGLGNDETTLQQLIDVVEEVLTEFPNLHPKFASVWRNAIQKDKDRLEDARHTSVVHELLAETILHYAVSEYYRYDCCNFCRAYDSHEVYYFPNEVAEVTQQFQ